MKILNLNDVVTFGKYAGYTVQLVIDIDPRYIEWCISNNAIELDNTAFEYYENTRGW